MPPNDPAPVNTTAACLLGLLHDAPMTGWELMRAAATRLGNFWSLTQSQVYRELTAMAGRGLVVAGEAGVRERRPFTITDDGRAAFVAFLHATPADESIRYPLLLTLAFGRHLEPERLAQMLTEHRQRHAQRLAGYLAQQEAAGPSADAHALATLRFGIHHERATLAWFDELAGSSPDALS